MSVDERLTVLPTQQPDTTVRHQLVATPVQTERFGFLVSPGIQVDGVEVFAKPGSWVRLACRRYRAPQAPTPDQSLDTVTKGNRR